jgi:hypothetical protein
LCITCNYIGSTAYLLWIPSEDCCLHHYEQNRRRACMDPPSLSQNKGGLQIYPFCLMSKLRIREPTRTYHAHSASINTMCLLSFLHQWFIIPYV